MPFLLDKGEGHPYIITKTVILIFYRGNRFLIPHAPPGKMRGPIERGGELPMKITKASDYALALLSHLAAFSPGERASVKQVADCCGIPKRFLAIIVHRLSKRGLLHSMKGNNGGIWLARRGSEITLREVIEAIEGPIRMTDCQHSKGACRRENYCSTRHVWNVAHERILDSLSATTLEELTKGDTVAQ